VDYDYLLKEKENIELEMQTIKNSEVIHDISIKENELKIKQLNDNIYNMNNAYTDLLCDLKMTKN